MATSVHAQTASS